MRIKRLDLKAFGPFTDKVLNFNCETPGLHIIFGANEAGKSSALRALKVLLYGFPQRTTDNFNHPNNQLLVGGCLEEAHGKQLTFYRRKKRKADIVDSQGNPLEADISDRFLQGIEFSVFESLYGIDHKTLVQGGKDILDQKGEVGQALFSAGAGITSLKDIQDSLDKEAENLFKPRGSTQKISLTLKKYKDFKKQVKEKSLHSGKWKEHNQRLNEARIQQKQLEQEKNRIAAELERLKRLKRVIPQMARLENLQNQLRDFGDVVILPEQFQKNNQKLDLDIQNTQSLLDHNRERQKKLDETIRAVVVNQPILDHAEAIEDLHQRLGEYRKGLKDRSRLDGMRIARRKDAGAYLEAVRPDLTLKEVDVLKPVLNRKRTIQELSTRYESMVQRKSDLGRHIDDAVKEIEIITETLSRLPEVKESKELVNSIKLTRKQGDIDGLIEELSRDISGTQSACQSKLNRLGLWPGKLDDLPGLNLPMGETIRRFETDFNKIENTKNQYKKEQEKLKTELKAALTSAREVEYSGDIPTEHTLNLARQKRQKGWDLLLRQWVNKEDVSAEAEKYEKGSLLHLAYEKQVVISDHIADRMRREADRIAKAAALKARIESLEQALLEISLHKKTADNQKIKKQEAWQALWKPSGISPLLPEEMLAWLMDMDRLRSKVIELSHKKQAIAKHKEVRLKHCTILVNELKKLDRVNTLSEKELIAPALAAAESALEDIQNTRAKYNKLMESRTRAAKTLEKLEKELKKAETLDAEWHENWEKALKGLGLTQKILPSEGMDIFDTLDNCFTKLKEANEFQSRIKGIDRDTEKFIADINALVHKTAPELKELSPDQAVLHLRDMLVKARQNRDWTS
ncbi:MAG: AAA family ATPase [Desulfobacteraceae bacterium]